MTSIVGYILIAFSTILNVIELIGDSCSPSQKFINWFTIVANIIGGILMMIGVAS